ncbi:hypothetical protein [Anaerosporobacter sp.]|uniref:hypothetical protein n=1 Tax=Anaerosporobacter sp. TaxID=1872529 RepID=UPI00286EDDA8|nr:hypothetical protein [Anaerosporobacter sp.]
MGTKKQPTMTIKEKINNLKEIWSMLLDYQSETGIDFDIHAIAKNAQMCLDLLPNSTCAFMSRIF